MNGQPNQQSQNAVTEEEKRVCKKCEKRLPNKSYFCMYCGTDNAPTSVQVEYEKANNLPIPSTNQFNKSLIINCSGISKVYPSVS